MMGIKLADQYKEKRFSLPWVDGIISKVTDGTYYHQPFFFTDHLGNITETKGIREPLKRFRYDSFGNTVYEEDGTRYEEIRFTGRDYFPEVGLYYFRNRWYSPKTGRFISEDPARIAIMRTAQHGWLLYSYGKNNLVFYRDPMGLQVCEKNAEGVVFCCVDTPFAKGTTSECTTHYPPDYRPPVPPKCRECILRMGAQKV